MIKQGGYDHRVIDKYGCLFLDDLKIGADQAGHNLQVPEVLLAYEWAAGSFMRPKDCYIGGISEHEEIVRIGRILAGGSTWAPIKYLYREDEGEVIHGTKQALERCNYFIAGVPYPNDPDGTHFFQAYRDRSILWNPGQTTGRVITFRGYRVE